MSIVVETTSTTAMALASSVVVTKPTGTVDGDFLFASIGVESGGTVTVNSVPSGWTLVESTDVSGAALYTYKKTASSEGSDYTWGLTGSAYIAGSILRISGSGGVDQKNEGDQANDDTPSFATGITPTNASSLIIIASTSKQNGSNTHSAHAITTSDPAGWTAHANTESGGVTLSVVSDIRPETTSTGAWSLTAGSNGDATDTVSQIISLIPVVDVTVSGSTGAIDFVGNDGSVSADSNVTGSVGLIDIVGNDGSVETPSPTWINEDKTGTASFTNETKS